MKEKEKAVIIYRKEFIIKFSLVQLWNEKKKVPLLIYTRI